MHVLSNILALDPMDLCNLASLGSNTTISSTCTVFAESEVVGLIGRGESKENLAYAVIDFITTKVSSQAMHIDLKNMPIAITGGLCECNYLVQALGEKLNVNILADKDARFAGAIGAALFAKELV